MKTSELEQNLAFQLRAENITDFRTEFRFSPKRKFRADFFLEPDLLVEVDGGVYSQGRHTRGPGYELDAFKQNLAVLEGYRYLRFGPNQVKDGTALDTIKRALGEDRHEL